MAQAFHYDFAESRSSGAPASMRGSSSIDQRVRRSSRGDRQIAAPTEWRWTMACRGEKRGDVAIHLTYLNWCFRFLPRETRNDKQCVHEHDADDAPTSFALTMRTGGTWRNYTCPESLNPWSVSKQTSSLQQAFFDPVLRQQAERAIWAQTPPQRLSRDFPIHTSPAYPEKKYGS
jgi:hypothetical protein